MGRGRPERGRRGGSGHVVQERKAGAVFAKPFQIQPGCDAPFSGSGICEDLALWIYDKGAARVVVIRVATNAVDANNIGLVFDRASLQERDPMVNSFIRPARDDGE